MTLFNVVPAGERELLQRGELPQQSGQQRGLPEDDEYCRSGHGVMRHVIMYYLVAVCGKNLDWSLQI